MRLPIRLSTVALAVVGMTLSAIILGGYAVTQSDFDQLPNLFIGIACLALLTAIAALAIVAVKVRSEEEVIERDEKDILAAIRTLNQQLNRLERRVETLNARGGTPHAIHNRASSDAHSRRAYSPVRPPRNYEDEE